MYATKAQTAALVLAELAKGGRTVGQLFTAFDAAGFEARAWTSHPVEYALSTLKELGTIKVAGWRAGYAVHTLA